MNARRSIRSAHVLTVAVASVCLLAATACGNGAGGGTSPAATGTPRATATATPGQSATQTVGVDEADFALRLSQETFTPGSYTFAAKNIGTTTHALAISGPGVPLTQTSVLSPGETAELKVTLREGEYQLWCPVDHHRARGMAARIQVGPRDGTVPTQTGSEGGYPAPPQ